MNQRLETDTPVQNIIVRIFRRFIVQPAAVLITVLAMAFSACTGQVKPDSSNQPPVTGTPPTPPPPPAPTAARILEVSYPSTSTRKFDSSLRIYIPGVRPIRGVIVRQHGCGRNGISMANDLWWQGLADKWNFALLGTFFNGDCEEWAYPQKGSLAILETALGKFATDANAPELTTVPWALWGHSGGGNWTYFLTQQIPARIIANVPRSGSSDNLPQAALGVPQLLSAGAYEKGNGTFGGAYLEAVDGFARERARGAPVALSIDPQATHDLREGRRLHILYLDAIIALRLGVSGLNAVDTNQGWLGNTTTLEVSSVSAYSGDKLKAAWLPNERVARAWQEFGRTGTVKDTTPPSAPTALSATRTGNSVRLTWSARADLESGIKSFKIYRNGTLVSSLGDPFQGIDFGDEPQPESPALAFTDDQPGNAPSYEVSTVNGDGLESPRSAAK